MHRLIPPTRPVPSIKNLKRPPLAALTTLSPLFLSTFFRVARARKQEECRREDTSRPFVLSRESARERYPSRRPARLRSST